MFQNEDGSSSPAQTSRKVPPELLCPICQSLFKEAIVTSCCGNSYCADCIEARILDPDNQKCPGADCGKDISITSIIPNKTLRDAAAAWLSATGPGAPTTPQIVPEPEQIRIRIGLKAPSSSQSQITPSGISPGSTLVQQQTTLTSVSSGTSLSAQVIRISVEFQSELNLIRGRNQLISLIKRFCSLPM